MLEPARISTEQRLEWSDTDASGHHHHSAMLRMAAVAEAELLERLGLLEALHGSLPRVHLTLDLCAPVRFRARLGVDLAVAQVGRTSIAFSFTITSNGATAADGRVVAVRVGRGGRPAPWTPRQRMLLLESGDVTAARPA
jgi:acyl-CoA thioesterase FadM